MKVHELLHRITFDDNARNTVVIFTDYYYEIFIEGNCNYLFGLFYYLEEDVKKYDDTFWFVGTKDMCHELKIYLSD